MSTNTSAAYERLVSILRRAQLLGSIGELLSWDEQVNLPAASADQRSAQMAVIAQQAHAALSSPETGSVLAELESRREELSKEHATVVTWARKDYDRATRLPESFVTEKAAQASHGYHAWAEARSRNNFASYAPVLEKNLELAKREAAYLGFGDKPYDYMIDRHDPGMNAKTIAALFSELKTSLVPLVRAIEASPRFGETLDLQGFDVGAQKQFLVEVTTTLGFDYQRGRIDSSLHPFCSGTGSDVRMTTRFKSDQPLDSLFSAIHETGHGLYEQGLPGARHATALGQAAGMGVHESQSRLWENQVARSRGFWAFFEPRYRQLFSDSLKGVSSEALYRAVNAVEPTMIRVDADEVTYNLHIILRFEIEQRLFDGSLAVKDLPAAWAEKSRELLGREPESDKNGVLQDVHWSDGAFGYFPSYCLGNMMAAQLWYAALEAMPGLEDDFARGDFSRLLGWLRREIHQHGKRYSMLELTERVTGCPLSPKSLIRYLRERYGALYGV